MAGTVPDEDDAFEAEHELAFAQGSERLPWLESDDDDDEPSGVDTGRLVAFAAIGLLAVVVLLGALWWLSRARPESADVAEGSVIEAPAGPYKVKPADPRGRAVAGTGDTSFEVAEGKQVEGRIAEAPPPVPSPSPAPSVAPSPSIAREPQAAATPKPKQAAATPVPSGIGVQVGAYSTHASAEAGWTQLSGRLAPLKGRSHRVIEGTADSGTVFRVQAVAGTVAEAEALCRSIKNAGGDCQVKR